MFFFLQRNTIHSSRVWIHFPWVLERGTNVDDLSMKGYNRGTCLNANVWSGEATFLVHFAIKFAKQKDWI